jgi:uncharacterized SAM-binding protein YcdF (DUF218 family)
VKIVVRIIGITALINFIVLPFISSLSVGTLLLMGILLGIAVYSFIFEKLPKIIHYFLGIAVLIPLSLMLFLGVYGNHATVTFEEDVVIVLGARVDGEQVSRHLARRLDTAVEYFQKNPQAYFVVCGGLGDRASITEAEAMKRYLAERGIPEIQIIKEDRSTSTVENLVFAKAILDERFPNGFQAAIISNDFHLYRAVSIASELGMDATRMGARLPVHLIGENYLREILAIINWHLFTNIKV